jgi:hypothetical protein
MRFIAASSPVKATLEINLGGLPSHDQDDKIQTRGVHRSQFTEFMMALQANVKHSLILD